MHDHTNVKFVNANWIFRSVAILTYVFSKPLTAVYKRAFLCNTQIVTHILFQVGGPTVQYYAVENCNWHVSFNRFCVSETFRVQTCKMKA
jgi:hypothetical protein